MKLNVASFQKTIKNLCPPAFAYFIISAISFLVLVSQNIADSRKFCLGKLSCQIPHVSLVFLAKILYIAFWTWAINSLCNYGYNKLAWTLLFLPIIMFFILAGLMILLITVEEVKHKKQ